MWTYSCTWKFMTTATKTDAEKKERKKANIHHLVTKGTTLTSIETEPIYLVFISLLFFSKFRSNNIYCILMLKVTHTYILVFLYSGNNSSPGSAWTGYKFVYVFRLLRLKPFKWDWKNEYEMNKHEAQTWFTILLPYSKHLMGKY